MIKVIFITRKYDIGVWALGRSQADCVTRGQKHDRPWNINN